MGLELVSDYSRQRTEEKRRADSMIKHTDSRDSRDSAAEMVANTILLTKSDMILNRLNEMEREIDALSAKVGNEGTKLAYMNKDLGKAVTITSQKMLHQNADGIREIEANMDRLASAKMMRNIHKTTIVAMAVSIVNLIAVIILAFYIYGYLK